MMTPLELAGKLERAAARIDAEIAEPTAAVMTIVEAQAREVVGTYRFGWPELAPATQADRVAKGFSADEPLLRTGELASSIKHVAERSEAFAGAEGLVYSDDPVAVFQELGTRSIPPRSFLFGSLVRAVPDMERIFGAFLTRILKE